jgi:ParB family chromosome partitioning protein
MQVPPSRLVKGAGSAPVDAWERIKGLFEADETDASPENVDTQQDAA